MLINYFCRTPDGPKKKKNSLLQSWTVNTQGPSISNQIKEDKLL